jgi:hypothetical protein
MEEKKWEEVNNPSAVGTSFSTTRKTVTLPFVNFANDNIVTKYQLQI